MREKIRLLVRADDVGSCWSSNMGCLKACTKGIARSVEVMMPCGWVSHAAPLFNKRPDIDVGIHLTLTSEWDAVKWRPLTNAPSLADKDGNFFPLLTKREGDSRHSLVSADWSVDEIFNEFKAQIELGLKMFENVSHISCHMARHFRDFDQRLGVVVSELCDQFGLADDAFGFGLPRFEGYPKFPRDAEVRTAAFIEQLAEMSEGTYIFIDHPAVASPELSATGHVGYEDVAEDRVSCLEVLTSKAVLQRIEDLGIELIGYRDL